MQPNVPSAAAAVVREVKYDAAKLVIVAALFNVGLPLAGDDLTAQTGNLISRARVNSQQSLAHIVIALDPAVKGPVLTTILKEAFPGAGVTDRHGPYWLSCARTGHRGGDKAPVKPVGARAAAVAKPAEPPKPATEESLAAAMEANLAEKTVIEETAAPEPVIEETAAPEPVIEETVTPEPVIEETVTPEPVIEETTAPVEDEFDRMDRPALIYQLVQLGKSGKGTTKALAARLRDASAAAVEGAA